MKKVLHLLLMALILIPISVSEVEANTTPYIKNFPINYKYVTKEHNRILQTKIVTPPIYILYRGQLRQDFFRFSPRIQSQVNWFKVVHDKHMHQLKQKGVEFNKIEPYILILDLDSPNTIETGGSYVYTSKYHTYNPRKFTNNSVVLLDHNSTNFKENMYKTFVHEFGHHIGYSSFHHGRNYSRLPQLRNNKTYKTSYNYGRYSVDWRNSEDEQFAESYMELFVNNHKNRSAVPNMNKQQKDNFMRLFRHYINNPQLNNLLY